MAKQFKVTQVNGNGSTDKVRRAVVVGENEVQDARAAMRDLMRRNPEQSSDTIKVYEV